MAKWALLLFDHDGFTTVCETRRLKPLTGSTNTDIRKADQVNCPFGNRFFLAEVLELAETPSDLDELEQSWLMTHRAISVQQEQDKRTSTPNVFGGYLKIWPTEGRHARRKQKHS